MFRVLITDAAYLQCPRDLEKIRDIIMLQAGKNIFSRAANSVSDGEEILKCKELIDQGFKRFEVSMTLVRILCASANVIPGLHVNCTENGHDIHSTRP